MILPPGDVYHTGYVVRDLQRSIAQWAEIAGAGPFVVFENFEFENPLYATQAIAPRVHLAFAYSGDFCVELIEVLDATPSVYANAPRGAHHVGIGVKALDRAIERYVGAGFEVAFRGDFPFGGACAYFDTTETLGVMTELVERTPLIDGLLARLRQAHEDWNRRDHTTVLP